jgi:hypothetical protein
MVLNQPPRTGSALSSKRIGGEWPANVRVPEGEPSRRKGFSLAGLHHIRPFIDVHTKIVTHFRFSP